MTTLVLVRHAKSDWGDARLSDHDRPLNARGLRDAPVLAARLAATGFRPDRLLTSTALRARTTADIFAEALDTQAERFDELYGAPAQTLLAKAVAARAPRVMIVAHDPGMSSLAGALSGGAIAGMPTCAVATFRWETDDWDVASAIDPDSWDVDRPTR